jgi:hypothetical protein
MICHMKIQSKFVNGGLTPFSPPRLSPWISPGRRPPLHRRWPVAYHTHVIDHEFRGSQRVITLPKHSLNPSATFWPALPGCPRSLSACGDERSYSGRAGGMAGGEQVARGTAAAAGGWSARRCRAQHAPRLHRMVGAPRRRERGRGPSTRLHRRPAALHSGRGSGGCSARRRQPPAAAPARFVGALPHSSGAPPASCHPAHAHLTPNPPLPLPRHEDRACGAARACLLSHLRLLRNCCAAGGPAAAALMRAGAHCVMPAVAADIQAARCTRPLGSIAAAAERQLLAAACQLLANFSVASEAAAVAIWGECFPLIYEQLTATSDGEPCLRAMEPAFWLVAMLSQLTPPPWVVSSCPPSCSRCQPPRLFITLITLFPVLPDNPLPSPGPSRHT